MRHTVPVRPLVDIQQVLPVCRVTADGGTDINIGPAVIIDIDYRHSLTPLSTPAYACFIRDIFELEITLIEIELIGHTIAGKIDIRAPIAVKVTDAYAAAIVQVGHVEGIDGVVLDNKVVKINAGMGRWDLFEQRSLVFATRECEEATDGYPEEE
jgi:hypothetical protein